MKRIFSTCVVVLVALLMFKNNVKGQDIHYSQFYNSPLNLNPALTGVFNGDQRFVGSVRDQWRTIPVPYLTFSGNYDMKIYPKSNDAGFFGVGALLNYDNAGDGNFNVTDFNLTGSYSHFLSEQHVITGGILLGVSTEGFTSDGDLTWDNYWNGEAIDPSLGNGEPSSLKDRYTYLETGAGINYRFQKSKRTKFNLGAGFFHLHFPETSFLDDDSSKLPLRTSVNGFGSFQLAKAFDIQIHGLVNLQQKYKEYVGGALLRIHVNQNRGKEAALDVGGTLRFSDGSGLAFIAPTLAFHYKRLYIGASYDVNMSPFVDHYDIRKGGPEVHVRYVITHVKQLSEIKACPIF